MQKIKKISSAIVFVLVLVLGVAYSIKSYIKREIKNELSKKAALNVEKGKTLTQQDACIEESSEKGYMFVGCNGFF